MSWRISAPSQKRRRTSSAANAIAGLVAVAALLSQTTVATLAPAFASNYLPALSYHLAKLSLIRAHVVADRLIGCSYVVISTTLAYLVYKSGRDIPFHWVFLAFGLPIAACGVMQFMEVITTWIPVYALSGGAEFPSHFREMCGNVDL
jgi:hypothetical protein